MATDLISRLAGWMYAGRISVSIFFKPPAQRVTCIPPAGETGDAQRGRRILEGILRCAHHDFDGNRPRWSDPSANRDAIRDLNKFEFLADLAATGEPGQRRAQDLVTQWIEPISHHHELAWEPDIVGARIAAWLSQARLLSIGAEGAPRKDIVGSLVHQLHYLGRAVANGDGGIPRLVAIKGPIYGAACGLGPTLLLRRGLSALRHELQTQILGDGTHVERSPAAQRDALALLVDIRPMLEAAAHPVRKELDLAIARAAPMLRFFRHGDGRLALFDGSTADDAKGLDLLLVRSRNKEPAPATASQGGFQRVSAGATLVILNAGPPPPPGFDARAHAGCLSFEMSDGADRIVVNRGASNGALHDALRATAAHSTLVMDNVNSAEVLKGGGLGRRPTIVDCSCDEQSGNVWVTASHDGYRDRFGLVHRRRLYVDATGDNLRCEDTLIAGGATRPGSRKFSICFHLHPDVQASLVQNGAAVLLRLRSRAGWRFQCSGGAPRLEDSIYCGDESSRRTQQIVIDGLIPDTATVKWAVQKVAPRLS